MTDTFRGVFFFALTMFLKGVLFKSCHFGNNLKKLDIYTFPT